MLKPGKKTKAWQKAKRKLREEFRMNGITNCEAKLPGCMGRWGLGFAHRYKRSDPRCTHEFKDVILACTSCHHRMDHCLGGRELTKKVFAKLRGSDD